MVDERGSFRELPEWPEDAKDLPEDRPPRTRFRWTIILGAIGLVVGFLSGMAPAGGDVAYSLGRGIGLGLILALLGYLWDWSRSSRERRARD
jgi:hypothetical protein